MSLLYSGVCRLCVEAVFAACVYWCVERWSHNGFPQLCTGVWKGGLTMAFPTLSRPPPIAGSTLALRRSSVTQSRNCGKTPMGDLGWSSAGNSSLSSTRNPKNSLARKIKIRARRQKGNVKEGFGRKSSRPASASPTAGPTLAFRHSFVTPSRNCGKTPMKDLRPPHIAPYPNCRSDLGFSPQFCDPVSKLW